jgi:hypothetical protein
MPNADRYRLHFGPYRTPIFKYGDVVICDVRGQVEIVGLSGGRIPWLLGKRGSARALVLCGALAKAVRLEAVSAQTVKLWRRAIGLGPTTAGTCVLRGRILLGEQGERVRQLAREKYRGSCGTSGCSTRLCPARRRHRTSASAGSAS